MIENLKTVTVNMTEGAGGVVSGYDYIYAYEPVGIGGVSVCVAAPFDEACGIIKTLFVMLCVSMVIAVAIGIFMAVIMANGLRSLILLRKSSIIKNNKSDSLLLFGRILLLQREEENGGN